MNRAGRFRLASTVQDRPSAGVGCFAVSAALLTVAVFLAAIGSLFGLVLAIPAVLLATRVLYEKAVLLAARHRRLGGVLVTSDSELWRSRIESVWIPAAGESFVVLNRSRRSERRRGRAGLAWRVHRCFAGDYREYCPSAIVLRGLRHPAIFRFCRAFKESKQGRPEALESLEAKLLAALTHAEKSLT